MHFHMGLLKFFPGLSKTTDESPKDSSNTEVRENPHLMPEFDLRGPKYHKKVIKLINFMVNYYVFAIFSCYFAYFFLKVQEFSSRINYKGIRAGSLAGIIAI